VDIHEPYRLARQLTGKLFAMSTQTLQRWICESCGYIYDPDEGDPDGGIPAGTAFEDIPDSWFCPVCGARKRDFTKYEA
jgi:rubredoxin